MDHDYNFNRSQVVAVDTETLVAQTQDRMWKALKRRYQYDSTLKPSQDFLLNHVNSKVSLVIMYADLVGSTNMSMTLPVDKMVTIVRGYSILEKKLVSEIMIISSFKST
jgi:adenylate cyclase